MSTEPHARTHTKILRRIIGECFCEECEADNVED